MNEKILHSRGGSRCLLYFAFGEIGALRRFLPGTISGSFSSTDVQYGQQDGYKITTRD